jgi:hypothetical protein
MRTNCDGCPCSVLYGDGFESNLCRAQAAAKVCCNNAKLCDLKNKHAYLFRLIKICFREWLLDILGLENTGVYHSGDA